MQKMLQMSKTTNRSKLVTQTNKHIKEVQSYKSLIILNIKRPNLKKTTSKNNKQIQNISLRVNHHVVIRWWLRIRRISCKYLKDDWVVNDEEVIVTVES